MSLENLSDLEAEWAVFMEDKTGKRNSWTQDQKWRADNPGEFQALLGYRNGGMRPTLATEPGRRMVHHISAYLKAKGTVPPPNPAGPVDYWHNYTAAKGQTTAPDYGWSWGMQMGGVLGGSGPANSFAIIPDGIRPGLPSARLTVAPDTYNDAVEGLYKWAYKIGEHKFYGMMVKFPLDWQKPSNVGWGAAINQPGYQGLVNSTLGTFAHADHCQFIMLTGEQTWPSGTPGVGSVVREYNNSEQGGTWPSGPRCIPAPMALGVWHQLIYEIKWSTCSSKSAHYADVGNVAGHVRIWHRVQGQTAWNKTVEVLDVPTLQWGRGAEGQNWSYNQVGANCAHKFGLYSGTATFPRVIEHGNISIGPTFESVAALMP